MTAVADIHINPDGTGTVDLDGRIWPLAETDLQAARHAGIGLVIGHAHQTGQPVRVTARDSHAEHHLLVTADGDVLPASSTTTGPLPTAHTPIVHRRPPRRWQLAAGLTLAVAAAALALPQPDTAPPAGAAAGPVSAAGTLAAGSGKPAQPMPIPGTRITARWSQASSWQATADAKAAAKRRAARQRAAQAAAPLLAQPAAPQYQQSPPQYQPPQVSAPLPTAPPGPTQPDVWIYPDPQINPN